MKGTPQRDGRSSGVEPGFAQADGRRSAASETGRAARPRGGEPAGPFSSGAAPWRRAQRAARARPQPRTSPRRRQPPRQSDRYLRPTLERGSMNVSSPGWTKHAWSCLFTPWNLGAAGWRPKQADDRRHGPQAAHCPVEVCPPWRGHRRSGHAARLINRIYLSGGTDQSRHIQPREALRGSREAGKFPKSHKSSYLTYNRR